MQSYDQAYTQRVCKTRIVSAIWCALGAASVALPAGLPIVGFHRGTRKTVIQRIVKIEGLGNRRVIDFLKHSSRLGLPGLDLEALSEDHFGAQNV